ELGALTARGRVLQAVRCCCREKEEEHGQRSPPGRCAIREGSPRCPSGWTDVRCHRHPLGWQMVRRSCGAVFDFVNLWTRGGESAMAVGNTLSETLLARSPLVSLKRFEHTAEQAHRDPPAERASCWTINFIEHGAYEVLDGKHWHILSPQKVFVT